MTPGFCQHLATAYKMALTMKLFKTSLENVTNLNLLLMQELGPVFFHVSQNIDKMTQSRSLALSIMSRVNQAISHLQRHALAGVEGSPWPSPTRGQGRPLLYLQ